MFYRRKCRFTSYLCSLLLILSGDVETNPGPDADSTLSKVLETIQQIEAGQNNISKDLEALKHWQASVDVEHQQLSVRVRAMEIDAVALKTKPVATFESADSAHNFSTKLKSIEQPQIWHL